MENCSRCETLPEPMSGTGKLLISSPLNHTLGKIRGIFDEHDHSYSMEDNDLFHTSISAEELRTVASDIQASLSDDEIRDVRALWMQESRDLTMSDLSRMSSLENLIGRVEGDWLIEILRDERLYNVFQPIVLAEDPGQIHGYECLLRARDDEGETIGPGRIFNTARRSDLLFQLDRQARTEAVRNGSGLPVNRKTFINFMPTSIYDAEYCLKTTMDAVQNYDVRKEQLVFEVVETEDVHDRESLIDILNYYRNEGVGVALDDLGAGYSSLNLLKDLKPDYIKLDLELVRNVHDNELQARLAGSLLEAARDNGIVTLAEGIETEDEWKWFRDHGADYLQGYYFAKPAETPAETVTV